MKVISSIEDVSVCLTCSKSACNAVDKYFVFRTNGHTGAAHGLICDFLDCNFMINEKLHGLYICRNCNNLLNKWRKHREISSNCSH